MAQELKGKTEKELLEILIYEKSKYSPSAILEAKQVYRSRSVDWATEKSLLKQIRRERRMKSKENGTSGFFSWNILEFVAELIFGISRIFWD